MTFSFRSLNKALALGLERTVFEYAGIGRIPESVQEVSTILRFTQSIDGVKCVELEDILAYSHQVSASHPQPPTFRYERIFIGKGYASRTLKRYGADEAFMRFAKNVWDNVDKMKLGYQLPEPLIIGKR